MSDACRPPGWLYILKQGGHDAQPDRVPGCGVTVMGELSIHWRPLLLNSDTPPADWPADRPNGADRRRHSAYRIRRDTTEPAAQALMTLIHRVQRGSAS